MSQQSVKQAALRSALEIGQILDRQETGREKRLSTTIAASTGTMWGARLDVSRSFANTSSLYGAFAN
jgi:hypothetical protein